MSNVLYDIEFDVDDYDQIIRIVFFNKNTKERIFIHDRDKLSNPIVRRLLDNLVMINMNQDTREPIRDNKNKLLRNIDEELLYEEIIEDEYIRIITRDITFGELRELYNFLIKENNNSKKGNSSKRKINRKNNLFHNEKFIRVTASTMVAFTIMGVAKLFANDRTKDSENTSSIIESIVENEEEKEIYIEAANIIEYESNSQDNEEIISDSKSLMDLENEIINNDFPTISIYNSEYSSRDVLKYTFAKSQYFNMISNYCDEFGLDAELMLSIATQERGIHSSSIDSGGGVGLMQIQKGVWVDQYVSAMNFKTGEIETIGPITEEMLMDEETNIKIACMIFRTCLQQQDYDIPMAIQCYNYGTGNMHSLTNGNTNIYDDNLFYDCSWLSSRDLIYGGDRLYFENVCRYLPQDHIITVKKNSGELVQIKYHDESQDKLYKISK